MRFGGRRYKETQNKAHSLSQAQAQAPATKKLPFTLPPRPPAGTKFTLPPITRPQYPTYTHPPIKRPPKKPSVTFAPKPMLIM